MRHINKYLLLFFLFAFIAAACQTPPPDERTATAIPTIASISESGHLDLSVKDPQWYKLIVSNSTPSDILLLGSASWTADEMAFLLYKKTDMGWKHLQPILDFMVMPLAAEPGLVITAESNTTTTFCITTTFWKLLRRFEITVIF